MRVATGLGLLLLLSTADCKSQSRRYVREEVVGEYVYAAKDEGLVVGPDGRFEHCLKGQVASVRESLAQSAEGAGLAHAGIASEEPGGVLGDRFAELVHHGGFGAGQHRSTSWLGGIDHHSVVRAGIAGPECIGPSRCGPRGRVCGSGEPWTCGAWVLAYPRRAASKAPGPTGVVRE